MLQQEVYVVTIVPNTAFI